MQQHVRARAVQAPANRGADALRTAGDEHDFSLQAVFHAASVPT
jgi:hypothetical protein